MNWIIIAWFALLATSFSISVLALTFFQLRAFARYGWRGFRFQVYWRELSPLEKGLVWPGVLAFVITWLAVMTWTIAASLFQ